VTAARRQRLKQKRYRDRRARGRIVLAVEVVDVELVEALVEAGLLARAQEDDRRAVKAALEQYIDLSIRVVTSNAIGS
jgi:hypothetical protein